MSNTGPYNDTPFQIDYEGAQIELKFVKTTPDTATLSWNIPAPFVGCDGEGAYNGIVITLDGKSVENAQRPVNGTFYTPDPTASFELHAGDKIGDAIVVGAFYDDTTTTSLVVPDIADNTAYYFSAYAVDQQGRYHRAGAHAYALEWVREQKDRDQPAYQEFRVLGPANKKVNIQTYSEPETSLLHSQWTGLDIGKTYSFTVCTDTLPSTVVEVEGNRVQNYEQLVEEFNRQIGLSIAPLLNAGPPNVGSLYVDVANGNVYEWTGSAYSKREVTFSTTSPDSVQDGTYWLDNSTNALFHRVVGVWEPVVYSRYFKPFNNLAGDDYWVTSTTASQWEGAVWCKRGLTASTIDPSLDRLPATGEFWYNTEDGVMYMWDESGCWKATDVIYYHDDPSSLVPGTLWYAYESHQLFVLNDAFEWEARAATYAELPPKTASDQQLWVDTKNDEVFVYNFASRSWDKADVLYWHVDPRDRVSCDKWWKSVDGVDTLYIWDFLTSAWVEATVFTQSATDPRTMILEVGHVWNRQDGHFFKWDGMAWVEINAIERETDPRTPIQDEILHVGDEWLQWNGSQWIDFEVLENDNDPAALPIGDLWFDTAVQQLKQLTAVGWVSVPYSIRPQVPKTGDTYFDVNDRELKEWKNGRWQTAELPIRVTINELNNLMFIGKTLGSNGKVSVAFGEAFRDDIKPFFFAFPKVGGYDGLSNVPSYRTEGVGTDGSADERREVITSILTELGLGGVSVELTKAQMERAVNSALETLRQKSSAAYKRGFMFLDVVPESQKYVLTNKNEGYNKIVTVHGAYRLRGGRIGAYSLTDPFEQNMIQQLYYAGAFDLLSYHMLAQYNELLNEMFANHLNFSWNEYTRTLMFHQFLRSKERVLLDVMVERSEQDLLTDRYTRPWLIKFATAKAMMMLSQIRGKFGSLPGAGGGVSLNAADLSTQAQAYMEECMDEIENFVVNSVEDVGGGASFILG